MKPIPKLKSKLSDLKGKSKIYDQDVKVKKNKKEIDHARRARYKKNLIERRNFLKQRKNLAASDNVYKSQNDACFCSCSKSRF